MPNDFVARWVSLFGAYAAKWVGSPLPNDEEEKTFYRVMLGLLCIVTALVASYTFATQVPNSIKTLVQLANPAKDDVTFLRGVGWVLNFLIWLFLSPIFVGLFYSLRLRYYLPFLVVALLAVGGTWFAAKWRADLLALLPMSMLLAIVAVCPELPKDGGGATPPN